MTKLSEHEPKDVLTNFYHLTRIPRCSGQEKQVSDHLVAFAQSNGLDWIQEDCYNVIINKPATKGYENAPQVILQAHMDMVCVKNEALEFDFSRQPIPVLVEADTIKAQGTSLGADNGVGVAMIMAILADKDLQHPPITALFTVSEETGLEGVTALKAEHVKGEILINLDGEEEGVFLSSSAGGVTNIVLLPIAHQKPRPGLVAYKIRIDGLLGGHSGVDINSHRANAIRLMGRMLAGAAEQVDYEIAELTGGDKMNVIPMWCETILLADKEQENAIEKVIAGFRETFRTEYVLEPSIEITVGPIAGDFPALTRETRDRLIGLMLLLPTGVETMSSEIPGLVESSCNIGVVERRERGFAFICGVRSSVKSRKSCINEKIRLLCQLAGASMTLEADYPEWEFAKESPIRDLMIGVYREMFDSEPKIGAIHGGLECGFLQEKVGGLDMVSIGPDIFNVHSINETVSITSVARVYLFLRSVLTKIS